MQKSVKSTCQSNFFSPDTSLLKKLAKLFLIDFSVLPSFDLSSSLFGELHSVPKTQFLSKNSNWWKVWQIVDLNFFVTRRVFVNIEFLDKNRTFNIVCTASRTVLYSFFCLSFRMLNTKCFLDEWAWTRPLKSWTQTQSRQPLQSAVSSFRKR